MSSVIKQYLFIPVPFKLTYSTNQPDAWQWQNRNPVSAGLSVLLFQWIAKQANSRPKWN